MINKEKYRLPEKNYIPIETDKKRIVIGNSFSVDMSHYNGWLHRYNGRYQKTAPYTISIDGTIYEHFDPKYYSEILGNQKFDEASTLIVIENEGWLIKDLNDENKYITHVGNIYNRTETVFMKKWRHNRYWAPYNEKQIDSLIILIKDLCGRFNIPEDVISHNTKISDAHTYEGILYKSNLNTYFTDVNPCFDFSLVKDKVEIND